MEKIAPYSRETLYYINCDALGDVLAAAAALNYIIKTFHMPRNVDYKVVIYPNLEVLFPFVPKDKLFFSYDDPLKPFHDAFDKNQYIVRKFAPNFLKLHEKDGLSRDYFLDGGGLLPRFIISGFHSIQAATISLINKSVDLKDTPYVSLNPVNVDKFSIDFHKSVIISATYRDDMRKIKKEEILKISEYINSVGLIPIFVGKTGNEPRIDFERPKYSIDLVNKTTISELATIMSKSRAYIGMDSGITHLAFTTKIPVICGFTSIRPELRIPYRKNSITIPIIPEEIGCRFCQSDWNLIDHDFAKCPIMKIPKCIDYITADKIISALKDII